MKSLLIYITFLLLLSLNGYCQKPDLIIPSGQNSRISVAKITPNGKYLLSAATDRSIKIYDVKEKKEVFTFWEHEYSVDDIAIAPNNRTIVSVADNGEILIWDLYSGKIVHKLKTYTTQDYHSIKIHPDGKTFLAANNGVVSEFDLISGKLNVENLYLDLPINKMDYIKNGLEFYIVARDSSKLDSLSNFAQTRTIDKQIINDYVWKSAVYQSSTFSEDGFTRYDVTKNPNEVRIGHLDENLIRIPIENYSPFEIEVLSKNQLLIACQKDEKIVFLIFNTTTLLIEKVIETDSFYEEEFVEKYKGNFKMQKVPHKINEIIFTTALYNSKIFHTNLATGITSLFLTEKTQTYQFQLINDNLFLAGSKNNLTKWNLKENSFTTIYPTKDEALYLHQLKDENLVIKKNKILIWDKNFTILKDSLEFDSRVWQLAPSPDGKKICVILGNEYAFFEYPKGKTKMVDFIPNYQGFEWLNNNELVFISRVNDKTSLLITTSEKIEKVIPIQFNEDIEFDERYSNLSIISLDNTILFNSFGKIFKVTLEGKVLINKVLSDSSNFFLEYNPYIQQIIAKFDSGEILFLNPKTLEITKRLKGHKSNVYSILFSDDLKKMFTYSVDNTIKIWDYEKETLLSTISILNNKEWVVVNDNDLFDASSQAMKEIYYVVNDASDTDEPWKIIELEQLKHRYYQPNLLQIQLGYNKEPLRTPLAITEIPLPPKVVTTITGHKLKITVKNQKGGIGKVVFFIENAEIITDLRPKGKTDQDAKELIIDIDLDTYKNRFTASKDVSVKVIAWNKEEWIRSRPEIINYSPIQSKGAIAISTASKNSGEKTRLFALIVGTSDYAGKQIDLNYASKDAIDFANALQIASENLFEKDNSIIELLTTDNNDAKQKPSRENILNALKALEVKMKPSDILVVYLSGHGVNYGGAEGDFYYLTQEASGADAAYLNDEAIRNSSTISSIELTQLLNSITAKKKLLILDACASGKAAEKMTISKDVPASQIRALDRMQDRTGFYILAGSASDAVSYESSVYGQGLLTYSLLKAIKGSALREDGKEEYIDVQKLFQFAVDEVPELSKNIGGIQKPFFKSPDNQQSYDIGKVDLSTKNKIIISEPKPVFIEAVFSDSESLYDELGLSETFNANLQENAAKGKSADIAFMRVKEYAGAYRISGSYTQNADEIKLNYIVIQNKKPIQPISTITISKNALIQDSITKIIESLKSKIN